MTVPYTFQTATSAIPLANLDANFAYYDGAFSISGTATTFAGSVTLTSGTANGVAYLNGSKVLTTGSALTFDGTNLGIGGTPSWALDITTSAANIRVAPAVGTNNALTRYVNTGGTLFVGLDNSAGGISGAYNGNMWHTGAYSLVFGTNSLERMRIDSSGNVGIATTIQKAKLQVNPGNVSTVGAIASSGLMIENYSGVGNLSQIGFGYATSSLVNTTAYIALIETNATGNSYGDLVFGTRNVTTDTVPTERMRIDSSGNVGIGTTSSAVRLTVAAASPTIRLSDTNTSVTGGVFGTIDWLSADGSMPGSIAAKIDVYDDGGSYGDRAAIRFYTNNATSLAERARIDSSGNLLVGTTSQTNTPTTGVQLVNFTGSIGVVSVGHATGTATGNYYSTFAYAGGLIGSITQSGTTAVLYNVTSDQRLKENIVDAPEFGSVIDSIKVRSYDWKAEGSHQRAGFVAQELVTVAPEAVHQPADPEEMMAVDYSKLVPMLVKEIQSLRKRLTALESKEIS